MTSAYRSHAQGFTSWTATFMTLLVTASLLGFHTATVAAPAAAASPSGIVDTPAGTVNTMAVAASGTTYVGGAFTSVGANTGSGALVSASNGTVNRSFPSVNGTIAAVVSDGAGGYYITGSFTAVDGVPRNRAARILSNGNLDPRWNPNLNGNGTALAVSGSTVYIGGAFTTVGPTSATLTRNRAAAVDATTGTATAWDPNLNATVNTLAISGTTVYLGGSFSGTNAVNGNLTRNRAAAVDTTTGTATNWNPNISGTVNTIAVSDTTIYLGGSFSGANSVNGNLTRNRAAAVDTTTGTATAWDPNLSSNVNTLVISGTTVYIGGNFALVNSTLTRRGAAAVDTTTGTATDWNPNLAGVVYALVVSGTTVYIGGSFSGANSVNGNLTRNRATAVDATTGTATAWDPNLSGSVNAVAISGSTAYLGGTFTHVNLVTRNRAAAFDDAGRVTAWNPNLNNTVSALAISGTTVYLGGTFSGANSVNGTLTRNRAAAFDTTTGTATAWDPNLSSNVTAIAVSDTTVYLGGFFFGANSVNGTLTRNRAAAVDTITGTATDWNPNLSSNVNTLAVSDTTVYIGGNFSGANSINGNLTRNRAAAVNATTGTATDWNPNLNGTVNTLAISGNTVYISGTFIGANSVNGTQTRNRAAAVNATTGIATAWDPNLGASANAMAISSGTVYLVGTFSGPNSVNGSLTRNRAAAVDATTGTATPWDPNLNNNAFAIAVSGGTVLLGGNFTSSSGSLQSPAGSLLARITPTAGNPPQPTSAAVTGGMFTWPTPLYGGVQQYYVMYRQQGATYPWAIYATGLNNNNPGIALDNPGTRNACSATNTAMGYTSCPMVRGWTPGITYELAVVTRTTEGKNSLNPIKTLTTYTVPAR